MVSVAIPVPYSWTPFVALLLGSAASGLWALSGSAAMSCIWGRERSLQSLLWVISVPALGVAWEPLQAYTQSGTFDPADIAACLIAGLAGAALQRLGSVR
jgi:hypothetical protein